jgi:hypothetical protein
MYMEEVVTHIGDRGKGLCHLLRKGDTTRHDCGHVRVKWNRCLEYMYAFRTVLEVYRVVKEVWLKVVVVRKGFG